MYKTPSSGSSVCLLINFANLFRLCQISKANGKVFIDGSNERVAEQSKYEALVGKRPDTKQDRGFYLFPVV